MPVKRGRRGDAKLRKVKGRRPSSRRWLERQIKDPYVAAAKDDGRRSRAAYKLSEIDDRLHVLAKGQRVVDLGAAPGGWSQVAAERIGKTGRVVAVDLSEIDPLDGVIIIQADIRDDDTPDAIRSALGGPADVVLSDMAAPATGHQKTDHLRVVGLCEDALAFAETVLAPGGSFICKVMGSGAAADLLATVKRAFRTVKHVKPPASRADSAELYLVATGYRGEGAAKPDQPSAQ